MYQRCINVVQRSKSDVGFWFIFNVRSTLFQRWSTTLKQRCSHIEILAGRILLKNSWTDCWIVTVAYLKKQPPELKKFLWKFRKFFKKSPALVSLFNKFAGLRTCNFLSNRIQHRCFSSEICETLNEKVFVKLCFCIFTGNFIYSAWKIYT